MTNRTNKALSLVELMIAMSVLVVVAAGTVAALYSGQRSARTFEERKSVYNKGKIIMETLLSQPFGTYSDVNGNYLTTNTLTQAFSGQHTMPSFTLYQIVKGQAVNFNFTSTDGTRLTPNCLVYDPSLENNQDIKVPIKGVFVIEVGHYLINNYTLFFGQPSGSVRKRYDASSSIPKDMLLIKVWYCSQKPTTTSKVYSVELVYTSLRYEK